MRYEEWSRLGAFALDALGGIELLSLLVPQHSIATVLSFATLLKKILKVEARHEIAARVLRRALHGVQVTYFKFGDDQRDL